MAFSHMKDHAMTNNDGAKINVLYSGFTFVATFNRNTDGGTAACLAAAQIEFLQVLARPMRGKLIRFMVVPLYQAIVPAQLTRAWHWVAKNLISKTAQPPS